MTQHSLKEVAANHLPPEWTDGERWLRRRLNSGELTGTRLGRTWVMDDADIAYMLRRGRNAEPPAAVERTAEPAVSSEDLSFAAGLSEQSRRRLNLGRAS